MTWLRNKYVWIAAGVVVVLLVIGLVLGNRSPAPAEPELTITPQPSPSESVEPVTREEHPDRDAPVADFEARYPAIKRLPYENLRWELAIDGSVENDKLPIQALITVPPGEDKETVKAQQLPFIEQWLTSIGQQPGTYDLHVRFYIGAD